MVRRIWFVTVGVAATVVLGAVAVVAGMVDRRRRWCHRLVPLWSRIVLAAAGVRVRVEGEERLRPSRAPVLVANHQSNLDIPVLGAVLPADTLWLAKRELFSVPVFGQAIRALGMIPVDRADPDAAKDAIGQAARRVAAGSPVVLFPEGTRSPDGRLRPFKPGFLYLAEAGGAPVVPVAVRGTSRLWPKGAWTPRPGTVRVTVLGPVAVARVEDPDRRREQVQAVRDAVARVLGQG